MSSFHFNSAMVQLKALTCNKRQYLHRFQFRDGTIKRYLTGGHVIMSNKFQFRDGTIKSHFLDGPISAATLFQFRDGTIKSRL